MTILNVGRMPHDPGPQHHARHPIVDYIKRTYSGDPAIGVVSIEVATMLRIGVPVTTELVDYLFTAQAAQQFREQRDRQMALNRQRSAQRQAVNQSGYVYFLRHGERIKIGHSVDPGERAQALSLRESDIMAVIEGGIRLEKSLHAKFASHRIGNTEWFDVHDELLAYIEQFGERFTKHHRSRKHRVGRKSGGFGALVQAIHKPLTNAENSLPCD